MESLVLIELENAADFPKLRTVLARIALSPVLARKAAGLFLFAGEAGDRRPDQLVQTLRLILWLGRMRAKRISIFEIAGWESNQLPSAKDLATLLGLVRSRQADHAAEHGSQKP